MGSVNGWELFAHPEFSAQLGRLAEAVERARRKDATGYLDTGNAKLLAQIEKLVWEVIPQDPGRREHRQGSTLGAERKHWFRVKFGGGRFRLFFRYRLDLKVIVYGWVNDAESLRAYGSKTDAYAVFRAMLDKGSPPDDWTALMKASEAMEAPEEPG